MLYNILTLIEIISKRFHNVAIIYLQMQNMRGL